jgi:hypothetical protein
MHMQRPDLATFCDQQDLEGAFYFFIFSWLVGVSGLHADFENVAGFRRSFLG